MEKLPDISKRRGRRRENLERDAQIVQAIAGGATLAEAAKPWGLTPTRAHAIYRRALEEQLAAAE